MKLIYALVGLLACSLTNQHTVFANGQCFSSTLDLLTAQATDPLGDDARKFYELCPGETITIGVAADPSFSNFVNGDWPLGIIRPNVTIEGNGATLTGGSLQMVTVPFFALGTPDGGQIVFNARLDDIIVRNLTFTSPISIPGFSSESVGLFGPGDVVLQDVTFQNIDFEEGQCGSRPIYVGESSLPLYAGATPAQSISLEVQDATFENIDISNCTSIAFSSNQTLTMNRIRMDTIDAFSAVTCEGSEAACFVSAACISNADFSTAAFSSDILGDMSVNTIYVGENVDLGFCDEPPAYISTNDIPNDGIVVCKQGPALLDACSLDPPAPMTDAPTATPTATPSGTGAAFMESLTLLLAVAGCAFATLYV